MKIDANEKDLNEKNSLNASQTNRVPQLLIED